MCLCGAVRRAFPRLLSVLRISTCVRQISASYAYSPVYFPLGNMVVFCACLVLSFGLGCFAFFPGFWWPESLTYMTYASFP